MLTAGDDRTAARLSRRPRRLGCPIVAGAWVDPAFKQALLDEGPRGGARAEHPPGHLASSGVAENTPTLHNIVVCAASCSCYL